MSAERTIIGEFTAGPQVPTIEPTEKGKFLQVIGKAIGTTNQKGFRGSAEAGTQRISNLEVVLAVSYVLAYISPDWGWIIACPASPISCARVLTSSPPNSPVESRENGE